MTVGIKEVRDEIETAIADVTPDYLPGITYSIGPKMAPLEELDAPAQASLCTREFQVVAQTENTIHNYNLTTTMHAQLVKVSLRYFIPQDDDGYVVLSSMTASDTARLNNILATRSWSGSPGVSSCDLVRVSEESSKKTNAIHILHLYFMVQYFLGAAQ